MGDSPILSVRNAARLYRSGETVVRALDGVSCDIHPGEVGGILGPSGSGKSTLLLIAGLLEPPTTGEIYIRDFRLNNIDFVFQKANLIPFLKVVETVALEIDDVPARAAREYASHLLGSVDLAHRVGNLPARLSGGEQQRVAVARALANDPALFLADEPTAALDSVRGRQVIFLFRQIADTRRAGVAIVTHDPRVQDLFDRTIELRDGRIVIENVTAPVASGLTDTTRSGINLRPST